MILNDNGRGDDDSLRPAATIVSSRYVRSRLTNVAASVVAASSICSCGGHANSDRNDNIRGVPRAVTAPTRAECASARIGTATRADNLLPRSGVYQYRVSGHMYVAGDTASRTRLAKRADYVVSPALHLGKTMCFTVQRRLANSLVDAATFVIRGADAFMTQFEITHRSAELRVRPTPPVMALSGSEFDWSGSFAGRTRGRFRSEIIGRRTVKIGPRRVQAIGVQTQVAFAGEIRGTEISTRWYAIKRNIIVSESVRQRRTFGLDEMKLSYRAQLVSMRAHAL